MQCDVSALRAKLSTERAALGQTFLVAPDPRVYFAAHTRLIDRALCRLFRCVRLPDGTSLVAIGGYGRREQYPRSDVDLLILLPQPPGPAERELLEPFINALYSLGLDLSPTIRALDQCVEDAEADLALQTALLENRFLCGRRELLHRLSDVLRARLDATAFFDAKRREQAMRHHRFQDSPFHLEPNLKEAPGGLRDLHLLRWVTRAGILGDTWRDLAQTGLITDLEAATLSRLERFLQQLRIRLHMLSSRKNDCLRFELQMEIAAQLGTRPAGSRSSDEVFMQRYYRVAQTLTQLGDVLLQNIAVALSPSLAVATPDVAIDARFTAKGELLDINTPDLFERDPGAVFESFLVLGQHPELQGPSTALRRALWHARRLIDARFRRDPENCQRFLAILQQPRGLVHALRWMNQFGLLAAYLPPFRRIVGQMQHDHYHIYTVDQHTLRVIRNLRRFTMIEFTHEFPFCSRLMAGFERPWLLYIAALFHDIAKGRGGDHSRLGKREALRFCRAHALDPDDTVLVAFLVEHHLAMSKVSQREDPGDPKVIYAFSRLVRSERRLTGLYLLTVADIRGTNPAVWNAWKEKLLNELFHSTVRVLRGAARLPPDELEVKRGEVLQRLILWGFSSRVHQALWRQLDTGYFLRHDANAIAWHTRTLHYRVTETTPVVKARLSPLGEGIDVLVYCPDQPELFARLCGFFAVLRFSVVEAKIYTTRHGYALDTFLVVAADRKPIWPSMMTVIEEELRTRLSLGGALPALLRHLVPRRLQVFPVQLEVTTRLDDTGRAHVLTLSAADRPGLLYAVARVLARHAINVLSAKIITLGDRAEDVFVVEGEALRRPDTALQLEAELLQALR